MVMAINKDTFDFVPGEEYWLGFEDGSRIKVEVRMDPTGYIDLVNEQLDFGIWVGLNGVPQNRDAFAEVERASTVDWRVVEVFVEKHVNDDPEFNDGFDRLAALISEPSTPERDCE